MIWRQHIHKVVLRLPDSWSNWNLEMLVFEERGKAEYPEKNPQRKGENLQQTRRWDLNPGHIGGRRVLSPLYHFLLSQGEQGRIVQESSNQLAFSLNSSNIDLYLPKIKMYHNLLFFFCQLGSKRHGAMGPNPRGRQPNYIMSWGWQALRDFGLSGCEGDKYISCLGIISLNRQKLYFLMCSNLPCIVQFFRLVFRIFLPRLVTSFTLIFPSQKVICIG